MMANIVKIDDKTYRIENEYVYYYLLLGDKKALLIDSGAFDEDVNAIVSSITRLPIILANTHGDMDHTAGNKYFEEFYMNKNDYERCGLSASCPNAKWMDLKAGQRFDLGGRHIRVIEIPGHTYGSVTFLDETNRWIFSGDTVSDAIIFMFGEHRCPKKYADALYTLISLEEEYDEIFPAHGTPRLKSGYARNVLSDWEKVLSGTAGCAKEDVHGTAVDTYRLDSCGFYYERV